MIAEAAPRDPTRLSAQYEALRAQVVVASNAVAPGRPHASVRGVGLALLLREGLPGWLRAVQAVLQASGTSPSADSETCAPASALDPPAPHALVPPLSGVLRHDLATALASLVLSTHHRAGPSPHGGIRPCP